MSNYQKKLKAPIYITAISSLSNLGTEQAKIFKAYHNPNHFLKKKSFGEEEQWVGELSDSQKKHIRAIRDSDSKYSNLDDSVLYAMYVSRKAIEEARWQSGDNCGINIGSSRGATTLFENFHREFINQGAASTLTSPTTTLGNISSWVAHDLKSKGPVISHSITCSTALHALLNGVAWLQSGLAEKFLVGGSEAPLTPFTIAQMQALKIYSKSKDEYPCRALDFQKRQNSMVLGEGAAMACLEKNKTEKTLAEIVGIGYATEPLEHNVSISTDAQCFQDSMRMALREWPAEDVDAIVMHAPGTIKGDLSEYNAIKKVFGERHPALTTNKWKMGHTFGASGMLSIELAILMLQHQEFIPTPFFKQEHPKKIEYIMVNAVGFGGNAVSILLKASKSN